MQGEETRDTKEKTLEYKNNQQETNRGVRLNSLPLHYSPKVDQPHNYYFFWSSFSRCLHFYKQTSGPLYNVFIVKTLKFEINRRFAGDLNFFFCKLMALVQMLHVPVLVPR